MPSRLERRRTVRSSSSSSSGSSSASDRTQSTAPTVHSVRPALPQRYQSTPVYTDYDWDACYRDCEIDTRSSGTSASTSASSEDQDDDLPPFDVPELQDEPYIPLVFPATPEEFAEYFPSSRAFHIGHDDSTLDGNMNLRVDVEAYSYEKQPMDLTLFHLRMHDLKTREFSLRRYCRDSGREVCHSNRKYTIPSTIKRPGKGSMSSALSNLRPRSESKTATLSSLKRHDSGYGSSSDNEVEDLGQIPPFLSSKGRNSFPLPTNTTQLEFSNYAHVDVRRRGTTTAKRYDFDYWGTKYAWKRMSKGDRGVRETWYHLVNVDTGASVAHIVPMPLTPAEAREEDAKGGWVPPSILRITDEKVYGGQTDLAEYVSFLR